MSVVRRFPAHRQEVIREEFKRRYQSVFEPHENDGGIRKSRLRSLVVKETSITSRRALSIIGHADENMDGQITLEEFVNQMCNEDVVTLRRLAARKRFLNHAVRMVVPSSSFRPLSEIDEYIFYEFQKSTDESIDNFVQAYTCVPPPIFIPLISMIQVAIFLYYELQSKYKPQPIHQSPLAYSPGLKNETWRYLTYMFLHADVQHLTFNLIYQLCLGLLLELVHKCFRVGIIYILGVLTGSLFHTIWNADDGIIGASGGCYALIGAHIANVILNWKEMQGHWHESVLTFISSAFFRVFLLAIFGISDLTLSFVNNQSGDRKNVSITAHVGGFLSGLLIGVPVLKNLDVKPWEKIVFIAFSVIYCLLMLTCIILHLTMYNL